MSARLYFFDENQCELVNHPLNGTDWSGAGSIVALIGGCHARLEYYKRDPNTKNKCSTITLKDFPGHDRILVKEQFQLDKLGPEDAACSKWLFLVSKYDSCIIRSSAMTA